MSSGNETGNINDEKLTSYLRESLLKAPDGIVDRVMSALPDEPDHVWYEKFMVLRKIADNSWVIPAFAGAAAGILLLTGFLFYSGQIGSNHVVATFKLHAPDAMDVELVGSFNRWCPGTIVLDGPDNNGQWTTTVELRKGRHEYMFLVDGKKWVTDPAVPIQRPDGFGRKNAVIEI